MNKKLLFALWGVLFVLCAVVGFLPAFEGGLIPALLFFLPPALLLYRADTGTALLIRNLSALSLGITMVTLILNFMLAVSSEAMGNVLHYILVVVSAPMVASGYWVLSLFLWACLLMVSLKKCRKKTV